MTVAGYIVLGFYALYTILTIVVQRTGPAKDWIKKLDILNLIPNYKFFCPKPVRYDYHLYYRLVDNETVSRWQKIRIGHKKSHISFLWNPAKKENKVFNRMVQLIRENYKGKQKTRFGHMYLTLLDVVRSEIPQRSGKNVQFRITYNQALRDKPAEKIYYTSIVHKG